MPTAWYAILSRAEPSRAEPSRAEPSRAEPSRAEPSRAEPSRAEPSRAEPSRAEPSRELASTPRRLRGLFSLSTGGRAAAAPFPLRPHRPALQTPLFAAFPALLGRCSPCWYCSPPGRSTRSGCPTPAAV